jgi:hypothetical protein
MATPYSSARMPVYGIHRNDLVNENFQATIGNDGIDMGSESFYPPSHNEVQASYPYTLPFQKPNSYFQPQMGFAPTFPTNGVVTYNGGFPPSFQPHNAVPYFQSRPSFTPALSPISGPSTSTPSPVPVRKEEHKVLTKLKPRRKHATRNATQTAKGELLVGKPKKRRGPNKRPPGSGFSNLLVGLFRPR